MRTLHLGRHHYESHLRKKVSRGTGTGPLSPKGPGRGRGPPAEVSGIVQQTWAPQEGTLRDSADWHFRSRPNMHLLMHQVLASPQAVLSGTALLSVPAWEMCSKPGGSMRPGQ